MDWFQALTGFRETDEDTRAKLVVEGDRLRSLVNGKSYGIGDLELVSLRALRDRAASAAGVHGRLTVGVVRDDVRRLHERSENAGALFQVASQFNLLEMTHPGVTPEDGVTRYQDDHTQGPACAIAAGAATIYRNYFVPVGGGYGQTRERQLDGLADLGRALSAALGRPLGALWRMRNGYALCTAEGLRAIAGHLERASADALDDLRGRLRIGLHRDVEVTTAPGEVRPLVSQAFCAALPVAYTSIPPPLWQPFASLVLQAAYEATLWSAALNAGRGRSNTVFLTALGGGAFGNEPGWIRDAIRHALTRASGLALDVRLVSHREPPSAWLELARDFR